MDIQSIIAEADLLVPNEILEADKLLWINSINQDFFNVVKIPKIARFACVASQADYILPDDVRSKNIDLLMVGLFRYQSLASDLVIPTQNMYSFDDVSHTLSLFPAPYSSDQQGVLRYRRIATTTYTTSNLAAPPDAPEEYHWTYIPALAVFLALAQDDGVKAANYEAQYKSAWNAAAQNYQNGVSE